MVRNVLESKMKKRIFFLLYSMNVGGVERALLGLLSIIPLDKYEVHVGLLRKEGEFLDYLPEEVIVHEINCYEKNWQLIQNPPILGIKRLLRQGNLIEAFAQLLIYIQYKIVPDRYWFYKYIIRKEPSLPYAFDLAVSFAGPSSMIDYYVCEKVEAKKKCGWIHFDVTKINIDKRVIERLYKKFEKIFIVSESGKKIFDEKFPQFADKTELFHNVVLQEQILSIADNAPTFNDHFEGKRILTVGRLSEEKGQRIAINALKILLNKGHKVKWYFVGEGDDRDCCEQLAAEYGISDRVEFLGLQTNPYGFMRDCDVYVQPSLHEGFCITLAESLCFRNPIVATNFTGAEEQLRFRKNGIITSMSANDIARGVLSVLEGGTLDKIELENPRFEEFNELFDLLM